MHPGKTLTGMAVGLWLVGLLASKAAAGSEGQISEGASLARDACSACHQVSPDQKPPPPVIEEKPETGIPAPSFMKIARDRRNTAARLRKVLAAPHYPMREQKLDREDEDAIISYIRSLRTSRPSRLEIR